MNDKIINKLNEINKCLENNITDNSSLMIGKAGIILYKSYYNKVFKVEKFDINLELNQLFNQLSDEANYLPFCGGFSGAAWMFSHLINNQLIEADIKEIQILDEYIEKKVLLELENDNYDYLHGGLGMAWYLLENGAESKKHFFSNIVLKLQKKSIMFGDNMIFWKTREGVVNFSLSHGITSVLFFLSECYKLGIEKEICGELITKGINYIQSYKRLNAINNSYFPNTTEEKMLKISGRLAWCYGDLGIALMFHKVGLLLNDNSLLKDAIQILEENSKRTSLNLNYVLDGTFCHGSSGICYMFYKGYLETNNEILREATYYWLDKTLEFGNENDGFAGFKTWNEEAKLYENNISLLQGISGIGLVLLSLYSNNKENTSWDKCFLLS